MRLVFLVLALSPFLAFSQFDDKSERLSLPQKVNGNIDGIKVSIEYGAPEAKGRKIFGGLVPYGELWRTGANEATTIEFSEMVAIAGKELKEGKYALFTIPGEREWIVIFNSEYDQWGDFNYDEKKDVLRLSVTPEKSDFHEVMEFEIDHTGKLYLYWENLKLPLQIASLKNKQ